MAPPAGSRRDDPEAAPLVANSPRAGRASSATPSSHADTVDWLATGSCFLFPALAGLLFGYDIGCSSGALAGLTSAQLSGTDWYALSPLQSGFVVSSSLLGALLGSAGALLLGNRIGRRTELLLAAGLYGLSATGAGAAGSLSMLLLARTLYGVGIGFAMHAAPAYIAETSPPSVRGLLISLKEAAIVGGILLGYLAGYWFVDDVGGWRSMYGAAAPLALLLGAGMAALPESPRYLLLSGASMDAAKQALMRAEGRRADDPQLVQEELDAMASSLAEARSSGQAAGGASSGGGSSLALFQQPRYSRPLRVGLSLMLFQQITGQPSVLYYAQQIFEQAGFSGGQEAAGTSVILGSFKLLMTMAAVATVDKWGRRPLLLSGVSAMIAALLVLAATQSGLLGGAASTTASLVALLAYVGAYQVSFGPISWLIVGESFPLAVRSSALALATLTNFGSNFAVSLALPTVQESVGLGATYLGFACIAAVAVACIYSTVPETKGLSLEQIEQLWDAPEKR